MTSGNPSHCTALQMVGCGDNTGMKGRMVLANKGFHLIQDECSLSETFIRAFHWLPKDMFIGDSILSFPIHHPIIVSNALHNPKNEKTKSAYILFLNKITELISCFEVGRSLYTALHDKLKIDHLPCTGSFHSGNLQTYSQNSWNTRVAWNQDSNIF